MPKSADFDRCRPNAPATTTRRRSRAASPASARSVSTPARIAAFASVGATALEPDAVPPCAPAADVPIVFFHGSLDPSFPPEGRTFGDGPTEVSTLSIDETLAAWVERNDCRPSTPQRTELPDVEPDGTTTARVSWSGCDRGELTFYEITGGGHTWPGSPVDFNDFLGPDSRDVAASQVIVDFFLSHRL